MIGERLKHAFAGNDAWILSYRDECFDQIGLKASVKIPLFNGALECQFRKYQIFDGKYKEFRSENSDKEFKPKREDKPARSRHHGEKWNTYARNAKKVSEANAKKVSARIPTRKKRSADGKPATEKNLPANAARNSNTKRNRNRATRVLLRMTDVRKRLLLLATCTSAAARKKKFTGLKTSHT